MITINTVSDKYFTLDGTQYARIYQPLTQGDENISILNIFDTRQKLVNSTKYDEFTVDTATFANQTLLIAALLDVIWTNVGTDSGGETQELEFGDQGSAPNYDTIINHTRNRKNPIFQLMNDNGVVINVTMLNNVLSLTTFTLRFKHLIVGTYYLTIF